MITAEDTLDFASSITVPGTSATFKLKITDTGTTPLTLTGFGFSAPGSDEEIPLTVNGENYYFGSQLYASVTAVDGVAEPLPTEHYLVTLNGDTPTLNAVELYGTDVSLEAGQAKTFTVTVTFYNANTPQNEYKNFGSAEKPGLANAVCISPTRNNNPRKTKPYKNSRKNTLSGVFYS